MVQEVTVGRIVHYLPREDMEPLAAIVTRVSYSAQGLRVDLHVFGFPGAMEFHGSRTMVPFSPEPKPACWSWPPRV